MPRPPAILLALCLAVAACGGRAAPDAEGGFIADASRAGAAEVAIARGALARGVLSVDERAYAQRVISDHQAADQELTALARQRGGAPPDLGSGERARIERMAGLRDEDFAGAWLDTQVADHRRIIEVFEQEAASGGDQRLRDYARKYLPILHDHLERARQLQAAH